MTKNNGSFPHAASVIARYTARLANAAFHYPADRTGTIVRVAAHLSFLTAGVIGYYYFLNGGSIQLELHDWAEVTAPRYAFLKDAVTRGLWPLHMSGEWALRNVTNRFMAVADTNLSPQVLLLRYLDVGPFVVANTLILYALGIIGLALLCRHLRLSPIAGGFLLGLLFFNGHITSHLAVGHVNWAALFLTPFFLYLVFRLHAGWRDVRWVACMSATLFALFLQGAFHQYVASLFFLALLLISNQAMRRPIVFAILGSFGLGMFRILPALLVVGQYDTEFLSGYPTLADLWNALVAIRPPLRDQIFEETLLTSLRWWEFDIYIGMVGTIIAIGIGGWSIIGPLRDRPFAFLALPIITQLAFSVGETFQLFHRLAVPLLSTQRVSSRMVFLPIAFLAVLGVARLQTWLDDGRFSTWAKAGLLLGGIVFTNDLWQHFKIWRVTNMGLLFPAKELDLTANYAVIQDDPVYATLVGVGFLVAVLTGSYLLVSSLRGHNGQQAMPRAES